MSRDGTGVPSIRQSKAKKARQKADDRLYFAGCDLPPAGPDDRPYGMRGALYQGASGLDALVQLLNWLIKTYELGRDDILRHYDVIGKECPYYFVKHPDAWEELLNSLAYDNAF